MNSDSNVPNYLAEEEVYANPNACNKLKEIHDKCFYKWYNEEFVKGKNTIGCEREWKDYETCKKVSLSLQLSSLVFAHHY